MAQQDSRPQTGQPHRDREGDVGNQAEREHAQAKEALTQMNGKQKLDINEGGRTQDSTERENPPGAVHPIPTPAMKGTWK